MPKDIRQYTGMHRYFARRPYNVFEGIIKHYSNPGDIILDPFCGGGITVVEGLRAKRNVIGIDINPMATFITRMEITSTPLNDLEIAKEQISEAVREKILRLYETVCPQCGAKAIADWVEWSYVVECPACHKPVNLGEAKKVGPARFECSTKNCLATFGVEDCGRLDETMIRLKYECKNCKGRGEKQPDEKDILLNDRIEMLFDEEKAKGLLNMVSGCYRPHWRILALHKGSGKHFSLDYGYEFRTTLPPCSGGNRQIFLSIFSASP